MLGVVRVEKQLRKSEADRTPYKKQLILSQYLLKCTNSTQNPLRQHVPLAESYIIARHASTKIFKRQHRYHFQHIGFSSFPSCHAELHFTLFNMLEFCRFFSDDKNTH